MVWMSKVAFFGPANSFFTYPSIMLIPTVITIHTVRGGVIIKQERVALQERKEAILWQEITGFRSYGKNQITNIS